MGVFPDTDFPSVSRLILTLNGDKFRSLAQPVLDLIYSPAVSFDGKYHL